MITLICAVAYGVLVSSLAGVGLRKVAAIGMPPLLVVALFMAAAGSVLAAWLSGAYDAIMVHHRPGLGLVLASVVTAMAGHLAWSIASAFRRAARRREAHLEGLRVIGRWSRRLGVLIIESPQRAVYCLATRPATIVVSRGALQVLTPRQIRAVLAHERAHLRGRHAALSTIAHGLAAALPWLPLYASCGSQIPHLLEMRADDRAAAAFGRTTVVGALAALALAPPPAALGAGGPSVAQRAMRLCHTPHTWRTRLATIIAITMIVGLASAPYLQLITPWCVDV